MAADGEHWVFGYGSLMWRPDFPFAERARATVHRYHRAFCITSTHYRGTAERPGLVLGLDRGRSCTGVAFRITPADVAGVIAYLRERELIYGVYREAHVPALVHAADGVREIRAMTYIAERLHPSYAGGLPIKVQAQIIRAARGISGDNLDYAINTVRHLAALGIREPVLDRLIAVAGAVAVRDRGDTLSRASVAALRHVAALQPCPLPPVNRGSLKRFTYRARLSRL
jgi:cation transport protein ChaC